MFCLAVNSIAHIVPIYELWDNHDGEDVAVGPDIVTVYEVVGR
jgi:hypothetical protein